MMTSQNNCVGEYITINELGKRLGKVLKPSRIPKELLVGGIKGNGTKYPPSTIENIVEYLKLPPEEKQKLTNLKKYGVVSTSQLKEVKEKQLKTLKKNHKVYSRFKPFDIDKECSIYHDDILVCSDYTGMHNPVYLYCNNCGRLFKRLPYMISLSCPYCTGRKMDKEMFILKAKSIHGDKYDYSEVEYVNNKTKVKIFCKQCNQYFYQIPNDHLSGHGHCIKSQKEEMIAKYLTDKEIEFKREVSFDECRGKKYPLPFDFYIPSTNTLIEVQGEQHYIQKFGEDLEERKRLDKIKREFALKNFNYIEIKYNEDFKDKLIL